MFCKIHFRFTNIKYALKGVPFEEGIAYVSKKITIETLDGEVIKTAYWYGVFPQQDDDVLETVGGGFYQIWSDELGSNSTLVGLKEFTDVERHESRYFMNIFRY
jgi:hypothetical protein